MLMPRRMGSFHGDANGLPFGYNDTVEGMAFPPDYRPRGPPPAPQGKPLLDLSDQENLNGFFAGFESNNLTSNGLSTADSSLLSDPLPSNEQPSHYFISSATHMQGQSPFIDPTALSVGGNTIGGSHFGSNLSIPSGNLTFNPSMPQNGQSLTFASYPGQQSSGHDFFDPVPGSSNHPYSSSWQTPNGLSNTNARPVVRFGSDSHFQPTGYIPPLGSAEIPDQSGLQQFSWLEDGAHSSTTNTQPNTEPSSPAWSRKRKAETSYHYLEGPGPGFDPAPDLDKTPAPISPTKKHKTESTADSQFLESPSRTPTRPRVRAKRKSMSSRASPPLISPQTTPTTTTSRKIKRASISSHHHRRLSSATRVTLTTDQKRANHTQSEQRRRDQTQRAFAHLFDLVPELETGGKLSQMRKLEKVVGKIRGLQDGNNQLKLMLQVFQADDETMDEVLH